MVGERIKEIINELGLKKVEFARQLNIDQSYVSRLVSGEKTPSVRLIDDICEKFNINKNWLLTGNGDMQVLSEDETAAYVSDLLEDKDNPLFDLIKGIMKTYSELGSKEKEVLKSFARDLAKNLKDQD